MTSKVVKAMPAKAGSPTHIELLFDERKQIYEDEVGGKPKEVTFRLGESLNSVSDVHDKVRRTGLPVYFTPCEFSDGVQELLPQVAPLGGLERKVLASVLEKSSGVEAWLREMVGVTEHTDLASDKLLEDTIKHGDFERFKSTALTLPLNDVCDLSSDLVFFDPQVDGSRSGGGSKILTQMQEHLLTQIGGAVKDDRILDKRFAGLIIRDGYDTLLNKPAAQDRQLNCHLDAIFLNNGVTPQSLAVASAFTQSRYTVSDDVGGSVADFENKILAENSDVLAKLYGDKWSEAISIVDSKGNRDKYSFLNSFNKLKHLLCVREHDFTSTAFGYSAGIAGYLDLNNSVNEKKLVDAVESVDVGLRKKKTSAQIVGEADRTISAAINQLSRDGSADGKSISKDLLILSKQPELLVDLIRAWRKEP